MWTHIPSTIAAWLLLTLVMAGSAVAAPVETVLNWTAPAERVDGTPLTVDEIAEYRIHWAVDGEIDPAGDYTAVAGEVARTVTIELDPRVEPYALRFAVTAVDTDGRVSDLSNVASQTIRIRSTAPPLAPTSIRFEIDCASGCVITQIE